MEQDALIKLSEISLDTIIAQLKNKALRDVNRHIHSLSLFSCQRCSSEVGHLYAQINFSNYKTNTYARKYRIHATISSIFSFYSNQSTYKVKNSLNQDNLPYLKCSIRIFHVRDKKNIHRHKRGRQ